MQQAIWHFGWPDIAKRNVTGTGPNITISVQPITWQEILAAMPIERATSRNLCFGSPLLPLVFINAYKPVQTSVIANLVNRRHLNASSTNGIFDILEKMMGATDAQQRDATVPSRPNFALS